MNTKQAMVAILKSRSERESERETGDLSDEASAKSEGNALREFNIETGLIGAGFFAKCGSVYSGGWSSERKAFNAVRAMLRKRNPDAIFKQVLN